MVGSTPKSSQNVSMTVSSRHKAPSCGLVRTVAAIAIFVMIIAASLSLTGGVTDVLVAQIAHKLENRFKPVLPPAGIDVDGIIVLGGAAARAKQAVELARRYPRAVFILSGPELTAETILLAEQELKGRLIIDRRPGNTFENALNSKSLAE